MDLSSMMASALKNRKEQIKTETQNNIFENIDNNVSSIADGVKEDKSFKEELENLVKEIRDALVDNIAPLRNEIKEAREEDIENTFEFLYDPLSEIRNALTNIEYWTKEICSSVFNDMASLKSVSSTFVNSGEENTTNEKENKSLVDIVSNTNVLVNLANNLVGIGRGVHRQLMNLNKSAIKESTDSMKLMKEQKQSDEKNKALSVSRSNNKTSGSLNEELSEILNSLKKDIKAIANNIKFLTGPGIYIIVGMIIGGIIGIVYILKEVIADTIMAIIGVIKDVANGIIGIANRIVDIVMDIVTFIKDVVNTILKPVVGFISKIFDVVADIAQSIGGVVTSILDSIANTITSVGDVIVEIGNSIKSIVGGVSKIVNSFAGAATTVIGGVAGAIGRFFGGSEEDEKNNLNLIVSDGFENVIKLLSEKELNYTPHSNGSQEYQEGLTNRYDGEYKSSVIESFAQMIEINKEIAQAQANLVNLLANGMIGNGGIVNSVFNNKISNIQENEKNILQKQEQSRLDEQISVINEFFNSFNELKTYVLGESWKNQGYMEQQLGYNNVVKGRD